MHFLDVRVDNEQKSSIYSYTFRHNNNIRFISFVDSSLNDSILKRNKQINQTVNKTGYKINLLVTKKKTL